MSAYEKTGDWESPRKKKELEESKRLKIENDIVLYKRHRFNEYMELADMGILTRELAISALREELEYNILSVDERPTEQMDIIALQKMLDLDES